jgi:SSS family solute:Na+ symporter/sodium/proline symporter
MIYTTVVLAYVLVLVGVAVYKSKSVKTADDFMVAGRSVPVYMLVATLVCTWIGSGSLFGTAGLTFRTGISELWFSSGAWVGILVIYFIAARVRKISQITLTDLLEKRYNQLAKVLGTITIIIAYMVIAGYQFKGGGRFISILSEGSITPEQGMLIACALIVTFTVLAGMVSIVSIDIFNGVVMLLAMVVTLPFAIAGHGGLGAVIETINAKQPTHLSISGGHDVFWVIGIALPTFLLLMSESSMYQKFASADTADHAKKAVAGMFIGVVLVEVLMMLIALVGFAIYADDSRFFLADGSINRAMAEEIILRIGFEQLPVVIGVLLLAAGAAIIISTGNTFLMVTSTNVTRDIFQAFFFKNASEKQVVILQRVTIVGIGVLAFLMMSQFETILEMALISYTMIGASLAPALLAAFFWKRLSLLGISFPMDTDYIAIPAVIVSVATLVIVSLATKKPEESDWQEFIEE